MLINRDYFNASIWAFVAIAALIYNSMLGSIAALAFLIAGSAFTASNISSSYGYCKCHWILFLIPLWALFSSVWSDIPNVAARGSVQLIITTIFAIVIASKVKIDLLLRAISVAMLIAMLMSLFSSRTALNGMTGEVSLIGIFNSKNFLATNTAMSICVAFTLLMNKSTDKASRILGAVLLVISILVLLKAKSFGAVLFVLLTFLFSTAFILYQNLCLHPKTRALITRSVVLLSLSLISLMVLSLIHGHFDEFMYGIGKDPTLTGRTYIWERGIEIIEDNPLLGVGYQSLFYIGNNAAEDIWEFAHVHSGAGFNFHNMYVDVSVELGLIGLFLFFVVLYSFFHRILSLKKIQFGSQYHFSILIFTYLFLQTFLEAGWLNQFTVTHLFICMAWVYLQEKQTNER